MLNLKTFVSIERRDKKVRDGYRPTIDSTVYLIEPDKKRANCYIMSLFQIYNNGDKTRRFSHYYGKCNQAKIIELSKSMIEVTENDDSWMDGELTELVYIH